MKRIISIFLIIVTASVIFIQGCSNTSKKESSTFMSYDQYRQLFTDISKEFTPASFKNVASTDFFNLVGINKEASFNKREFLTLKGDKSPEETQERIVYVSEDSNCVLFIDIIYLSKELDNDLVYWDTGFIGYEKYTDLAGNFNDIILSYHNTLLKLSLIVNNDSENAVSILSDINESFVKYLTDYNF